MATYEFNKDLKFILPPDFIFSREEDDEGNEHVKIQAGEYENDDGETAYRFSCSIAESEIEYDEDAERFSPEDLLKKIAADKERVKYLMLPGKPASMLMTMGLPMSIFGMMLKMYAAMLTVVFSETQFINIISSSKIDDDDPEKTVEVFRNMLEVAKALRYKGKPLNVTGLSPERLAIDLEPSFEDDGNEPIDISPKIQFNMVNGDETTTYEYTPDGMKEVGTEKLRSVDPDQELYPHYYSLRNNPLNFFPGAVINATGTEFEAYKFSTMLNTWSSDGENEERKPLLQKILNMNPSGYTLDETAKEMISLFRVDEDVFDSKHDREVELTQGYMRRAYMLSALRSFAWTLADYCKEHGVEPDEIDDAIPNRIANFVEYRDWLNYDGKTYCKGLCAGSDLHVYYLPDAVTKTDRKQFLPTQEDIDRVRDMKKAFPNYNEIPSEVHSLEALRKDLEYIYPAIKILYESLLEDRDTSEQLEGAASDVVYAWIAMAIAAAEPFFTEDGPMNYDFDQPGVESRWEKEWAAREAERKEEAREEWMRKYEQYLETNPDIDFNGTLFVFSGLGGHWGGGEKEHPIVQKVIEKGGQYRAKVSGITNYLVVDPAEAGASKMVAVLEQRQKGKNIKVILLEDLENALDNGSSTRTASQKATTSKTSTSKAESTSKTKTSSVSATQAKGTKVPLSDCDIEDGEITDYNGSAKALILPAGLVRIGDSAFSCKENITSVVIPDGVEEIGEDAFMYCKGLTHITLPKTLRKIGGSAFYGCESLTSVLIPDGVEEIGADAFTFCKALHDIYVPASVYEFGNDAFCTFCEDTVVHTVRGSSAERFAKENDKKVDYKYSAGSGVGASEKTTPPKNRTTQTPKSVIASNDYIIKNGNVLTGYSGSEKDIVIPNGIRTIGEDAFFGNDDILSVVVPEGVETIEDGAFWMCSNLRSVVLPSSIRKIGTNAFNSCDALTSIVIPDGCKEIGDDAFTSCKKLKDIYVPSSVYNIGNDAFYTFNDAMVIHTVRGSTAESFAKGHNWKVDYKQPPASAVKTATRAKTSHEEDLSGMTSAMSDLSAQIADMESQELSDEDRATLREVMDGMNKIGEQIAEGQEGLSKYGDYLEQKEAREKAAEEEKAKKKAEAMAAGKSEKDVVNMYIILTNEKKLGKLHRSQDEFYEIYEDDFPAMSKTEVIKLRKDMLAEMEDDSLCSYYAESFKQRSVKERFEVATRNLNNVGNDPDIGVNAEYAIANTQEWFVPAEQAEVRRLMETDLAGTRKDLDDQLRPLDAAWLKFSTGKEFLQICISDKKPDGSDLQESFSCFQIVIGNQLVAVQIASKGIFRMSTTIMNCFPWYWGVSVRDIWEAAMKNELYDSREGAYNGSSLANQAMEQIRRKYPTVAPSSAKTAPTTAPVSTPNATRRTYEISYNANGGSGYISPQTKEYGVTIRLRPNVPTRSGYKFLGWSSSSTAKIAQYQPEGMFNLDCDTKLYAVWQPEVSSPQVSSANSSTKKEGCYIATAVYGSYDAPEVMVLRSFRDNTLKQSAIGRWFIKTYYRLSPPVAEKLKNAKHINRFVRSILNWLVGKLSK